MSPNSEMSAGERLLKLLRDNPDKGNRMLTPEEIALLRQDRIESGEKCRDVISKAMEGKAG